MNGQHLQTVWDDLLAGIDNREQWLEKRTAVKQRFLELIRHEAAAAVPQAFDLDVEQEWDAGGFLIQYVSYQVEADERAHAYIAVPDAARPPGGFPGVICLHGTTNWGARRTLGLAPDADDPHADRWPDGAVGMDYARQLTLRGFVCIVPEHFCCASRRPSDPQARPFDTADFYRRHPEWSAVGKYMHDSSIATDILAQRADVDAQRLGVTGHSLGGQGSIWLAAFDERIKVVSPSCAAMTFREYAQAADHWSREQWYIYFPQLREQLLAGNNIQCDFHEMMALIAPRPLFERFALDDCDPHCQNHRTLLHLKLRELYRLYDAESAHSFLVTGDGHSIPQLSMHGMLCWMERWLQAEGNKYGSASGTNMKQA